MHTVAGIQTTVGLMAHVVDRRALRLTVGGCPDRWCDVVLCRHSEPVPGSRTQAGLALRSTELGDATIILRIVTGQPEQWLV